MNPGRRATQSAAMTTHTITQSPVHPLDLSTKPGRGRRSLLVVSGLLACAVPVVFTLNITRMLVIGIDTDHRFHQLTGQGEILFALWLLPLLALLRAGWQGVGPAPPRAGHTSSSSLPARAAPSLLPEGAHLSSWVSSRSPGRSSGPPSRCVRGCASASRSTRC